MKNKIFMMLCTALFFTTLRAGELETLQTQLKQLSFALTPFPAIALTWKHEISYQPEEISILDERVKLTAPSLDSLKNFAREAGVQIIQLVVAWQDLTLEAFLNKEENPIIASLFSITANHKLQAALRTKEKELDEEIRKQSLGGGYASCGYHAIAHLETLARYFIEDKNLAGLTNLVHINELFGIKEICEKRIFTLCGEWRKILQQEQKEIKSKAAIDQLCDNDGEWITYNGMLRLLTIGYLHNNNISYFTYYTNGMPDLKVEASSQKSLQEAIQNNKDNKSLLTFFINNGAHWYGIFVNVDKKICIIVDSKNTPRYHLKSTKDIACAAFIENEGAIHAAWHNLEPSGTPAAKKAGGFDSEDMSLDRIVFLSSIAHDTNTSNIKDVFRNLGTHSQSELIFIFQNFDYFAKLRKAGATPQKLAEVYEKMKNGNEIPKEDSEYQNALATLF